MWVRAATCTPWGGRESGDNTVVQGSSPSGQTRRRHYFMVSATLELHGLEMTAIAE
jgi:hypothetical protein